MISYSRKGDGHKTIAIWWGTVHCSQSCMNIAIQFIAKIVIALILQRCTACGTFETLNVKIFVLYAYKDPTDMISHKHNKFATNMICMIFERDREENSNYVMKFNVQNLLGYFSNNINIETVMLLS